MVYNTQNHWVCVICPSSGTALRTLGVFPSSGDVSEMPTPQEPLERADLNHSIIFRRRLRYAIV
jgi:hypothetical protein